jgi:hypothetical protein
LSEFSTTISYKHLTEEDVNADTGSPIHAEILTANVSSVKELKHLDTEFENLSGGEPSPMDKRQYAFNYLSQKFEETRHHTQTVTRTRVEHQNNDHGSYSGMDGHSEISSHRGDKGHKPETSASQHYMLQLLEAPEGSKSARTSQRIIEIINQEQQANKAEVKGILRKGASLENRDYENLDDNYPTERGKNQHHVTIVADSPAPRQTQKVTESKPFGLELRKETNMSTERRVHQNIVQETEYTETRENVSTSGLATNSNSPNKYYPTYEKVTHTQNKLSFGGDELNKSGHQNLSNSRTFDDHTYKKSATLQPTTKSKLVRQPSSSGLNKSTRDLYLGNEDELLEQYRQEKESELQKSKKDIDLIRSITKEIQSEHNKQEKEQIARENRFIKQVSRANFDDDLDGDNLGERKSVSSRRDPAEQERKSINSRTDLGQKDRKSFTSKDVGVHNTVTSVASVADKDKIPKLATSEIYSQRRSITPDRAAQAGQTTQQNGSVKQPSSSRQQFTTVQEQMNVYKSASTANLPSAQKAEVPPLVIPPSPSPNEAKPAKAPPAHYSVNNTQQPNAPLLNVSSKVTRELSQIAYTQNNTPSGSIQPTAFNAINTGSNNSKNGYISRYEDLKSQVNTIQAGGTNILSNQLKQSQNVSSTAQVASMISKNAVRENAESNSQQVSSSIGQNQTSSLVQKFLSKKAAQEAEEANLRPELLFTAKSSYLGTVVLNSQEQTPGQTGPILWEKLHGLTKLLHSQFPEYSLDKMQNIDLDDLFQVLNNEITLLKQKKNEWETKAKKIDLEKQSISSKVEQLETLISTKLDTLDIAERSSPEKKVFEDRMSTDRGQSTGYKYNPLVQSTPSNPSRSPVIIPQRPIVQGDFYKQNLSYQVYSGARQHPAHNLSGVFENSYSMYYPPQVSNFYPQTYRGSPLVSANQHQKIPVAQSQSVLQNDSTGFYEFQTNDNLASGNAKMSPMKDLSHTERSKGPGSIELLREAEKQNAERSRSRGGILHHDHSLDCNEAHAETHFVYSVEHGKRKLVRNTSASKCNHSKNQDLDEIIVG